MQRYKIIKSLEEHVFHLYDRKRKIIVVSGNKALVKKRKRRLHTKLGALFVEQSP